MTEAGPEAAAAYLQGLCRRVMDLYDAAACVVSRVIGDLLIEVADCSRSGDRVPGGHGYLIPDFPLTLEVIQKCEARSVALAAPDADPAEADLLRSFGFGSLLMLPLKTHEECWGLIEVYDVDEERFTAEDLERADELLAAAGAELGTIIASSGQV